MKEDKSLILKCLVGSRAHGLHTKDSDHDYRGVYVESTKDVLSLGYKYKGSHWLEGKEDQTTYEIGHFLHLALRCNPTILEVFMAPKIPIHTPPDNPLEDLSLRKLSDELRGLFPYVWNPQDAFNAFTGYGLNQRKKMLDKKDDRPRKYAVAYLRTLYNLWDLLHYGKFSLKVVDPAFKKELERIKYGTESFDMGHIINLAECLMAKTKSILSLCDHKADPEKVNDFLLKIRKDYF